MIKLRPLASLKEYAPSLDGDGCFAVEFSPGMTVGDALDMTGINAAGINFSVLVNNIRKRPSDVLQDGDVVTLMPLLAGG